MLSQDRKNVFILSRFNNLYPYLNEYGDAQTIKRGIEEDFDSLYELADMEICKKRHQFFALAGVSPEDYKERLLSLGDGKEAFVGIRFQGLNIKRPFVSVWLNFSDIDSRELKRILKIIKDEFQIFNPLKILLGLEPDLEFEGIDYYLDDYILIGNLLDLKKEIIDNRLVSIELATEMDFYEDYSREYDLFHKESPVLAGEVRKESFDDLKKAMDDSLLFKVMIDQKFVGVIAGRVEEKYGVKGICVLEKFLFSDFRNKGYGNIFQQLFINELAKRDYKILWGNIFHKNYGSLKTALGTGRKIVETIYCFDLTT